jgi:hypothetical protein
VGAKQGYNVVVNKSSYNILRGNLLMDAAKGGIRVFSVPEDSAPTDRNMVSDNISVFGEGGTIGVSDDKSSYNTVANNFFYGAYYASWTAKGNRPGFNTFRRNTIVLTPFSRLGGQLNRADASAGGRSSEETTVQDNLFTADHPNPGGQYLWRVDDWADAIKVASHNLFWRPGSTSTWTTGVSFQATDVLQQPTFVDPKNGDFSLAPGSPGKGAASDGKDIGISYNEYLKQSWVRHVLTLPMQEQVTSGTRARFAASKAHQYQLYVYIPESKPYQGIETFTIEGRTIQRDYKTIVAGGWVGNAPQRWVYLGTHPTDGSLDVSWTQASSVSKLFVRQMPTVEEAYAWIAEGEKPMLPTPGNFRVVGTNP